MTAARHEPGETPVLAIDDLHLTLGAGNNPVRASNGLSYRVAKGETLVLLGESGSGKSVGLLAATRLLPIPPGRIVSGHVEFNGRDVLKMPAGEWRRLAGREIGMVFQDALASLNPVFTVGWQICEKLRIYRKARGAAIREEAVEIMASVGIPAAKERFGDYPHQLSGGMRQRIMIAIAIAASPSLLICDEPTTALDVTVQAQILDLLKRLQQDSGASMIMVTHDLAVAAQVADRLAVIYAGRVVESGPTRDVLDGPRHPYTRALMQATPYAGIEDRPLEAIPGRAPDLCKLPPGCAFAARCPAATEICRSQNPPQIKRRAGHVLCHHAERP